MKLYLMQHGEAAPKKENPERPLTESGVNDVRRMAIELDAAGIRVGRVFHSGKRRARETAELMAFKLAPGVTIESGDNLQPNDDPATLLAQIEGWREDVLLVGHLPHLARLIALMVAGSADAAVVAFRQGSVACLEPNDAGGWCIDWMLRPELLN